MRGRGTVVSYLLQRAMLAVIVVIGVAWTIAAIVYFAGLAFTMRGV